MRHVIDRSLSSVFDSVFPKESDTPLRGDVQSLSHILTNARFFAGTEIPFTSVADSAATAQAGQLVVYRIGEDCPARLVADAMARGAAGILTEQVLPCPLPQCIVGDVETALASITADQLDRPDRKLLTVGVIGSAGKTTTSLMVATLFRGHGIRTAYQTDLGDSDGIVQSASASRLPTKASLVRWIAEAHDSGCHAAIIECDEESARHGAYESIQFDLLVVTGSTPAQADYGETGLQCMLERLAATGVVIAPADDPRSMRLINDSGVKAISYGIRRPADVTAKIIDQSGGMTTLMLSHDHITAVMESSLCGAAMATNHAAAAAVGVLIDTPMHEVAEQLSSLRAVPGCGQRIAGFDQPTVILDRAGTAERAATTLRTYRSMKSGGKLWCILAVDDNDTPEQLADYGILLERFCDHGIVTTTAKSKPRFLATAHAVMDGVEKCAALRLVADRQRAISWAIAEAGSADTIVVLAGFEGQTPHERRDEIERMKHFIESQQELRSNESPQASEADPPIILKIADCEE